MNIDMKIVLQSVDLHLRC